MKKNILKITAILGLSLMAVVGIAQTQSDDDDKKKKKKIEKRIEVVEENGETKVTVTTIEDGKESTETYVGEDAKAFLEKEKAEREEMKGKHNVRIEIDIDDDENGNVKSQSKKVEVKEVDGEKVVTVTTEEDGEKTVEEYRGEEADEFLKNQDSGNHFLFEFGDGMMDMQFFKSEDFTGMSPEEMKTKMETLMKELDEKMKVMEFHFDSDSFDLDHSFDFHIFENMEEMPEHIKEMLENMDIDLDISTNGNGKRYMVGTMVVVEDIENEDGKENLDLEVFQVYPNPTDGMLNIQFKTDTKKPANVIVNDINGKELHNIKVDGSNTYNLNVDMEGHSTGTYFISVIQGKKAQRKKFILK